MDWFTCSETVFLIQSLSGDVNENLLKTVFIIELLKAKAANVVLILCYLCYGRQDREVPKGCLVSSKVVCQLLSRENVKKVYVLDPHFSQVKSFFDKPMFDFCVTALFCEHMSIHYNLQTVFLIALDCGALTRARAVSLSLGLPLIVGIKRRSGSSVVLEFDTSLKLNGKIGVIVDDIIDTGKSVMAAIACLKLKYGLSQVVVYVSHNLLSSKLEIELITTNSVKHANIDISFFVSRLVKTQVLLKDDSEYLL